MCPYIVQRKLGDVRYELVFEVGDRVARVEANRLCKIGNSAVETSNPKDGILSDSLRILRKTTKYQARRNKTICIYERGLKVQIGGKPSPRWTVETDLREIVVQL